RPQFARKVRRIQNQQAVEIIGLRFAGYKAPPNQYLFHESNFTDFTEQLSKARIHTNPAVRPVKIHEAIFKLLDGRSMNAGRKGAKVIQARNHVSPAFLLYVGVSWGSLYPIGT